ncbi:MAG: hypothetical protein QM613_02570 [Micrococcaceae bacterium]
MDFSLVKYFSNHKVFLCRDNTFTVNHFYRLMTILSIITLALFIGIKVSIEPFIDTKTVLVSALTEVLLIVVLSLLWLCILLIIFELQISIQATILLLLVILIGIKSAEAILLIIQLVIYNDVAWLKMMVAGTNIAAMQFLMAIVQAIVFVSSLRFFLKINYAQAALAFLLLIGANLVVKY